MGRRGGGERGAKDELKHTHTVLTSKHTQTTPSQSCGELRSLTLDKNRIRSFESNSLSGLVKLKDLRVEENGLRSLSNFPVLPSLTVLSAAGNRISDVIELEKLCRVCDAREVSFANNPVTRKQLYRTSVVGMFPNVRVVDGREVTQEERERSLHVLHQPTASAVGFLQQHLAQPQGVAAQASMGGWGVQRDLNPQQMLLEQQQAQQQTRNRAQSLKGEGGMVPSLKATVKLTAVQFDSFAGLQPSLQSSPQLYSAKPPGANARSVWEGSGSAALAAPGGRRSLRGPKAGPKY